MPPSMKLPYRRATDPLTAINVGRTLLEASARGKDYPVTAVQKFAAVLAISGRRLDDVTWEYYDNSGALQAAAGEASGASTSGRGGAEAEGTAQRSASGGGGDDVDAEPSDSLHTGAHLKAMLEQHSDTKTFLQAALGFLDPRPVVPLPPLYPAGGPVLSLEVGTKFRLLVKKSKAELDTAMSRHSSLLVACGEDAAVAELLKTLGAANGPKVGGPAGDICGWCLVMSGGGTVLPSLAAAAAGVTAAGEAAAPGGATLRVLETRSAVRHGGLADATLVAPLANYGAVFEAPLLRLLTTSASAVAVFLSSPQQALLPLLAAVAAAGRRLRETLGVDLVLLPYVEVAYSDGGEPPKETALLWFVVAKCGAEQPDRILGMIGEPLCEGLVPRPRPAHFW